jgi:hypothetical protein
MSGQCTEPSIPVSYFIRIPNVGDKVNPLVVRAVSGRSVSCCTDQSRPHLIAIGSRLDCANSKSQVWGAGVMHPDLGIGNAPASQIYALRGRLSHSALSRGGVAVGDVPLGDPGYLAPSFLGISRSPRPKYKVGLVSHYVDRYRPIIRNLMKQPEVADLSVHESPEIFLKRMAECEVVISSSLHGLIFAESMGIPNLWIKVGDDIAGGDFKFRDWFSTTRSPQTAPYLLAAHDTADDLAGRAESHECTIDVEALRKAFPHQAFADIGCEAVPQTKSVEQCRTQPLPVFLISFNRGSMLLKAISAIRQLSTPTEMIIHDNGSTDPRTLAILEELKSAGTIVYRYPPINDADALNQVNESVSRYFSTWSEPSRYVVSDCDVDLSIADPTVFEVYDELLNRFRKVECVGPMLRISDIPRGYPLYNRVMNRHIEQFWQHTPTLTETSHGEVAILQTVIDTTLALHRAGEPFRRLKSALRVYEPFEARHLDWYLTRTDEDPAYAKSSCRSISHWNNPDEREKFQDVPIEYSTFRVVAKGLDGKLEIQDLQLGDMPPAMRSREVPPYGAAIRTVHRITSMMSSFVDAIVRSRDVE